MVSEMVTCRAGHARQGLCKSSQPSGEGEEIPWVMQPRAAFSTLEKKKITSLPQGLYVAK